MKKYCLLFVLLFTTLLSSFGMKSELDSLFHVLDQAILNNEIYVKQREQKIKDYKQMFNIPDLTLEQEYDINIKMYDMYYPFKPDSATNYMLRNVKIAEILDNTTWLLESKFRLVRVYTLKSLYIHALNVLRSISIDDLDEDLLRQYYEAYIHLFSLYPPDGNEAFLQQARHYCDSLSSVAPKDNNAYQHWTAEKLFSEGKRQESLQILLDIYQDIEKDTHDHAKLACSIGFRYYLEGDYDMQKKYYAIAAIADIKNGIKENLALRSLAIACYETNDIDRAYRYIYQSMEDARFANVNFRLIEISQIFPIIEKSYQEMIQKQRARLTLLSMFIGLLSLFLIIAMIYVSIQMRKLTKARKELNEINIKLRDLNEDLKKTNLEKTKVNDEILQVNKELLEANTLKETYISQFLTICSMYIKKLEKYQNTLNKKALEKKTDELYKMLKSRTMIEDELKDLYNLFDTIFLDLYPNFVEEFNQLMPENEQFDIKAGELLNTELRIFALIRLGIKDSSRIADFLHYSIATIYNYRTRVRNKSIVSNEDFENAIMKIGAYKEK